MPEFTAASESTVLRRVFETWSIEIPMSFAEKFFKDDGYWHAYDEHRSVSLTSLAIDDDGGPVDARRILDQFPLLGGEPINELPAGLPGSAVTERAPQRARASRLLSGVLAIDGRLLIATITGDDEDWWLRTWLSIREERSGEESELKLGPVPDWLRGIGGGRGDMLAYHEADDDQIAGRPGPAPA
jgi:hypothetical protein